MVLSISLVMYRALKIFCHHFVFLFALCNRRNKGGTYASGEKKTDFLRNGGMDLKYGINESFTLDATLIPDLVR